ncbi:MAG: hypothetical protein V7L20_10040 [Nostoc sp.]|uniref:hypothetical protein n=1 Tax=Nostoc sp. TaxID=1180 RepID=UPI002FF5A446
MKVVKVICPSGGSIRGQETEEKISVKQYLCQNKSLQKFWQNWRSHRYLLDLHRLYSCLTSGEQISEMKAGDRIVKIDIAFNPADFLQNYVPGYLSNLPPKLRQLLESPDAKPYWENDDIITFQMQIALEPPKSRKAQVHTSAEY